MTAPAGEVLIVGESGVGKQALLSRLLHSNTSSSKQSLKQQQWWDLDTKYYTARVVVERQLPSTEANPAAATCGGLVLVFAADQASTFLAVKQWVEQLPSDVADVRLCVANKIDKLLSPDCSHQEPAVQRSTLLQEAMQWCADSLFEYVEVSSIDVEVDQHLVWEEQPQGVQRVKEALEAHMWPGLRMKPEKTPQSRQTLPVSGDSAFKQQDTKATHNDAQYQTQTASDSSSGAAELMLPNAEEAEFDQLDKMFDELRSEHICASVWLMYVHT